MKILLEMAKKIYKPNKEQIEWVKKIYTLLDKHSKKVSLGDTDFRPWIGDLQLKGIEIEQSPCIVLIHWVPDFSISTKTDPCCSAFVLSAKELKEVYDFLAKKFG